MKMSTVEEVEKEKERERDVMKLKLHLREYIKSTLMSLMVH